MLADNETVVIRHSLKGSLRGRRVNAAKAGSQCESVGATILDSITECDHYPTPKLDQEVDLFYCSELAVDEIQVFEACLPKDSTINRAHRFFHLPTGVRHRIYSYCFPHESRKISLSPAFATKAVFNEDHFATAWDVTADVLGALESFRALHHELMTYFWTSYRFHVTLTPFSGRRFSPLDQIWLRQNLHIIQNLSVEVDYTKFGGSAMKLAPTFGPCKELNERMLNDVVFGLMERKGRTTMNELHIMCRRYAGHRRRYDLSVDTGDFEVPYCPESTTFICGAIFDMRELMLRALYSQGNVIPDWSVAEEPPWPQDISTLSIDFPSPSASTCTPTPSKTSEDSPERIMISKASSTFSRAQRTSASSQGFTDLALYEGSQPSRQILQLTRTQSFRQDVEEQMIKSEFCPEFKLGDCNGDDSIECLDFGTAASHRDNHQTTSNPSIILKPQDIEAPGQITPVTSAIPHSADFRICNHETFFTSTLTPIPQIECPLSHSPYTMNRINEQDPAFQRTLSAIRKREELVALQNPLTEQPQFGIRPVVSYDTETKMTTPYRSNGSTVTKRRYLALVNKFHNWTN